MQVDVYKIEINQDDKTIQKYMDLCRFQPIISSHLYVHLASA